MSTLSCHVLDTTLGVPARGISVSLYLTNDLMHGTRPIATAVTDEDGRAAFDQEIELGGDYSLRFNSEDYCQQSFGTVFFPFIDVHFRASDERHYHVPVLMSAHSYTTYRGS
ncbi:hydroxyisourate hydrolase [Vibrio maerlii]|uniref:hydroxyisourate hydrolase n=1 Tax=Vibrio maerlii TaxID=2231648 RepID=UPI000E3D5CC6|nr:hydroxyisourate hydrolase [Vibrio maerlii]